MAEIEMHTGGCACGEVRYQMADDPMFVHCCHCSWCQRETGSAFVINALIEADRVTLTRGRPETTKIPSNSGKGQKITRCPKCLIALWSTYAGAGDALLFVRTGTLDNPNRTPPSAHIFTSSKQTWVKLPEDVPAVPEYYRADDLWPEQSLQRGAQLRAKSATGNR